MIHTTRRPRDRWKREVWMRVIDPSNIRTARTRKQYTQGDLAFLAKCTQATISGLETGVIPQCSKSLATAIAARLDTPVGDLFEEHDGTRVARVTNAAGSTRRKATA